MIIERVRIQNFRSIRDLSLELGRPHVILEGKNDTGKSNIVHAIDLCLRHSAAQFLGESSERRQRFDKWSRRFAGRAGTIFRAGSDGPKVDVEVRFSEREQIISKHKTITFKVAWLQNANGNVTDSTSFVLPPDARGLTDFDKRELGNLLVWALRLVEAHREPRQEMFNANSNEPPDALPVWYGNNLKSLLVGYKNHADADVQARFTEFVRRCANPDFPVGELTVGFAANGALFARTRQNSQVFELEDRSEGIQQLVFLLALSVCHTGSVVVIEEPESHLSETLQRKFWEKLKQMIGAGIEQVIVTSHSHVFELESERIVVSRDADGCTVARHEAPIAAARPDYEAIRVSRDGTVNLPEAIRHKLDVDHPDGGTVYADTSNGSVRLLSSGDWAEEALGAGRE